MFFIESELHVFCFMILIFIFGNYFSKNRQKQQVKDRIFAIILVLSAFQIVSEASVEASMKTVKVEEMGVAEITAWVFYLFSMVLILQLVMDYLWLQTHEKTQRFLWAVMQLPAVLVVVIAFAMPFQNVASKVMQYCAILYTCVIIYLLIKGYRAMETRMRTGLCWYVGMAVFSFAFNHLFPDAALSRALNITMMDLTLFYTLQNPDAELIKELDIQKNRAEAATQAKSAFLSNMSHEIRTPINAVLGMDEMILRESSEDVILNYAEDIRTAGNSLLGLINDILDFSKIEAGKMDIIPVDYEISSVLNDLVNMIKKRAEDKGLELIVKVDSGIPHLLHGDEIRIKQIVTNILTNAVKYTEKGSVTLDVSFVKDTEDSIRLRISVKDTGIGIKEEDIGRLFSAFERIEEERNRSIEGTGLGMNITTQLLHRMGSRLEVESVYGEGSDFFCVLSQRVVDWEPIGDFEKALKRSQSTRKKYQESFTAPEGRILVVDDTPMNLSVIKGLLKKTLLQIDTAESGMDCLSLMQETEYDVVFLDHRMSGMDGIETFQEIKKLPSYQERPVPVLALTANAVSGAREEYMAAGFTDYLTKPIDPERLEEVLVKYLPEEKVVLGASSGEADGMSAAEEKLSGRTDGVSAVGREYGAGEEKAGKAEGHLEEVPVWITSVRQLDYEEGLAKCGTAEVYVSVVKEYLENIPDMSAEIEQLYQSEDWKNYTIKVHALKSTSAIIGAMEVSELAKAMEMAGNAGDLESIHKSTSVLLEKYRALKEMIVPPEELSLEGKRPKSEELPLISEAELLEAYEAIGEIASVFDYKGVCDVMESLLSYQIPEDRREQVEELKKTVKNMDWDGIKRIVKCCTSYGSDI